MLVAFAFAEKLLKFAGYRRRAAEVSHGRFIVRYASLAAIACWLPLCLLLLLHKKNVRPKLCSGRTLPAGRGPYDPAGAVGLQNSLRCMWVISADVGVCGTLPGSTEVEKKEARQRKIRRHVRMPGCYVKIGPVMRFRFSGVR